MTPHFFSFILAVSLHLLLLISPMNSENKVSFQSISASPITVKITQKSPEPIPSVFKTPPPVLPHKISLPPSDSEIRRNTRPIKKKTPPPRPEKVEKPEPAFPIQPPITDPAPLVKTAPERVKPPRVKTPLKNADHIIQTKPIQTETEPSPEPPSVHTALPSPALKNLAPDENIRIESVQPPAYPIAARRQRREGQVQLKIRVLEDGEVGHVEIYQSSGWEDFDAAALHAVSNWRFKPAIRNGLPIQQTAIFPVHFNLK